MARGGLAWSYSRLKTFETCPRQFEYRLNKTPEAPSPAMARGSSIHKDAERFLKGEHKAVPATLQTFEPQFKQLRKKRAQPEEQVALTSRWERTAWFAPDAWLRIVIDARVQLMESSATLIDFKTGREYDDHIHQLELYAAAFFSLQSKLDLAEGELWYLDQGEISEALFHREEKEKLQKRWTLRAQPLLEATEFPATPGRHCSWCPFSTRKGGPCKEAQ